MGHRIVLPLNTSLFRAGMRLAVAVSGGADSVALLRAVLDRAGDLGLVLSVAHLHHGLRGAEADADEQFVRDLAHAHNLEFHGQRSDTPASAIANREGIEEAARNLRYAFFCRLVSTGKVDAVATAHTLDDQAETVLLKLMRGAWTEGLGGIYPVYRVNQAQVNQGAQVSQVPGGGQVLGSRPAAGEKMSGGQPAGAGGILRPLLGARRSAVEAFLRERQQPWREDASNSDPAYARNRVRRDLLPILREHNPQVDTHLAALSAIARDEEEYWQAELARILPSLILPGRAVRGGGRASSTNPGARALAIELERLRRLHPALRRRVLRAALSQLGRAASFTQTEDLMALCGAPANSQPGSGKLPTRLELPGGIRVLRGPRELRMELVTVTHPTPPEYALPVPGEILAAAFCLLFRAICRDDGPSATVRTPRSGDRVRLRHTRSPKGLKEVFERMHIAAPERASWPIVEWKGEVVWMLGAEVESQVAASAELEIITEPRGPEAAE